MPSDPHRPNIVLIVMDTARADHFSLYGYGRPTTPFLEALAREGTLYENAITPSPWTLPSHASLFTGTYPSCHRVTRSRLHADPSLVTLMAFLRRLGYTTYGVSSNFWLSRASRLDREFDRFHQSWQLLQAQTDRSWRRQQALSENPHEENPPVRSWRERLSPWVNGLYFQLTRRLRSLSLYDDGAWRVNRTVRSWISEWQKARRPFFAFIHYMEPHLRYQPPGRFHSLYLPPGVGRLRVRRLNQNPWRYLAGRAAMTEEDFALLTALYDGEISYTDLRVGQVVELLREGGLLDSTLLAITSDHGENLGDHGLMDHQYCLYDSLLRVPLLVRYPPRFAPGARMGAQVQLVDFFPAVLRILEVRDKEIWAQMQGQSLLPEDLQEGRPAFAEYLEPSPPVRALERRYPGFNGSPYNRALRAVRTRRYKYIWASDGREELYDIVKDPAEKANLIAELPEVARELRRELEGRLGAEVVPVESSENIRLSAEVRRRLEALGYL